MKPTAIQLSEAAANDVVEVADWYASRSDIGLAERWDRAVTSVLLRIVDFPNSGALCRFQSTELRNIRRMNIEGFPKHLIFYRVEGNCLFILRILHGARDLEKLL